MYTSPESWINKIPLIGIWGCEKITIFRKSPLKLFKWSSLPCLLLIKEVLIYLRYEIYKISSWNMIFTSYPNDFWHNVDPYCWLLLQIYPDWFCAPRSHMTHPNTSTYVYTPGTCAAACPGASACVCAGGSAAWRVSRRGCIRAAWCRCGLGCAWSGCIWRCRISRTCGTSSASDCRPHLHSSCHPHARSAFPVCWLLGSSGGTARLRWGRRSSERDGGTGTGPDWDGKDGSKEQESAGVLETEATAAEASPSPASPGSHDGDAGGWGRSYLGWIGAAEAWRGEGEDRGGEKGQCFCWRSPLDACVRSRSDPCWRFLDVQIKSVRIVHHLLEKTCRMSYCIHASRRCFYAKSLALHSCLIGSCIPWESNPWPWRCKRHCKKLCFYSCLVFPYKYLNILKSRCIGLRSKNT